MRNWFGGVIIALASAAATAAILLSGVGSTAVQTEGAAYQAPRLVGTDHPDLNGIWQNLTTANWDIEDHGAAPGPLPALLGAWGAQPAGQSIVEGGDLPYRPEALERRNANYEQRLAVDPFNLHTVGDPEAKLFASRVLPAALFAIVWLAACGGQPTADTAGTDDSAAEGEPPRTAWGDPDLQGTWETLESVPLERPAEFGDREYMTEEEAAERANRTPLTTSGTPTLSLPEGESDEIVENLAATDDARNAASVAVPDDRPGRAIVGNEYNAFWNAPINARRTSLRTSQIVDPPDGQLPAYTRGALAMWDAREAERMHRGQADS